MKREMLKELGLEDSVIDKVMAEHGKTIESKKNELDILQQENLTYKEQFEATQTKLKEFESMDIEGIKASSAELVEKHKAEAEEIKAKLESQKYNFAVKDSLSKFKFSNELSKKALEREIEEKGFKLEGEKLLGLEDYMNDVMEKNPNAFIVDNEPNKPSFGSESSKNGNEPSQTDDDIMKFMLS